MIFGVALGIYEEKADFLRLGQLPESEVRTPFSGESSPNI